jgi:hypothetical protein
MGEGAADSDLLTLAAARFDQLSDAERKLLQAASTGEEAPADLNAPKNDPANAQSWGQDHTIRAALIQWLCFERKARKQVHRFGIRAIGARIDGRLDLSFATIPFPLHIRACWWPAGIVLRNASLPELSLTKCWVGPLTRGTGGSASSLPAIMACGVQIKGSLFLDRGFRAEGCVSLDLAEVGGALNCDGGSFKNAEGMALDAEGAKIGGAVSLQKNFESTGQVSLKSAEIGGTLGCDGSFRNANGVALSAEAAKIGGAVFLHDNFESEGEVLFSSAEIGGALNCDGGSFKNAKRMALSAYGAKIGGDAFLGNKNQCNGEVLLDRAEIRGALNCDGGVFENEDGVALSAQSAKIGGDVYLRESRCKGEVLLTCAEIGGALNCDGSFENANGVALRAEAARIRGAVCLHHNFKSEGEVLLSRAEIGGALNCDGGSFKNVDWVSANTNRVVLSAYGAKIGGDVFLGNNNRSEGQVLLDRAEIRGALNCTNGVFKNANGAALSAQGAKIDGDVCLQNNFKSDGEVTLDRAEIGGALHCNGGIFKNANGRALNANYAKIGRDVILELAVQGMISLEGASIAGDLTLLSKRISEASPAPAAGATLSLQRANIIGTLDLQGMPKDVKTKVDLGDSSCNVLRKHVSNPGEEHKLELHGFVYRRIEGQENPKAQLKWLRQQLRAAQQEGPGQFRPQPYRQFANSLRAHGHDAEARACLISMAEDRRKFANLSWASRAWHRVLWTTIRNGHQPLRALIFLFLLWAVGFVAFGWGYQKRVMEPSDKYAYDDLTLSKTLPGQYDPFCALVYAVDSILPIVSLGQRDRWHPRAPPAAAPPTTAPQNTASQTAASQNSASQNSALQTEGHGSLYDFFCEASFTVHWDPHRKWAESSTLATSLAVLRWFLVVLGWLFATMLVAGIAGLVGRE